MDGAAKLLFGTGGVPISSRSSSTLDGIKRIAELGLGCMELEFVRGVKMGEKTAVQVREAAEKLNVRLSCHAPYYINLNARDSAKLEASRNWLIQSARVCHLAGARSIAFHPAVYMGDDPEEVYRRVKGQLAQVMTQVQQEKLKVVLRPEVMGEVTQFGTLEELLQLCGELGTLPCIDFSHWYARSRGEYNTFGHFLGALKLVEQKLGRMALDNLHLHVQGVGYAQHGETKHLAFNDPQCRFAYGELTKALKAVDAGGLVICESPLLEEDARVLREAYGAL